MAWQLPSKNKSAINYLLIVLVFALLAFGIYMFFTFKIKAIEKGTTSAWQIKGKTNLKKSICIINN